jgi:hypothetical protein
MVFSIKHIWYFLFLFVLMNTLSSQTDSVKANNKNPVITAPQTTPTETVAPAITQTYTPLQPLHTTISSTYQVVDPNGRRHFFRNPSIEKLNKEIALLYKDTAYDRKAEIVIKNKRYRIYNNCITIGGGYAYNSGWPQVQLNSAVDYQFHVKKFQFQIGALLLGPKLLTLSTAANAHVGFGYKREHCNYFWAVYGGISYTGGYKKADTSKVYNEHISTFGGYVNAKIFYKINFDYGIGASAFFDINSAQKIVGIRAELFFSGAYKGFKKINWAKEDEKYAR